MDFDEATRLGWQRDNRVHGDSALSRSAVAAFKALSNEMACFGSNVMVVE